MTSLAALWDRAYHADGRVRRGAAKDLGCYDALGAFVWDDGYAFVSERELAQRLGESRGSVQRRLKRLRNLGLIIVRTFPQATRKSACYCLVPFTLWLQHRGKRADDRPEVVALKALESSESTARARAPFCSPESSESSPPKVVSPLSQLRNSAQHQHARTREEPDPDPDLDPATIAVTRQAFAEWHELDRATRPPLLTFIGARLRESGRLAARESPSTQDGNGGTRPETVHPRGELPVHARAGRLAADGGETPGNGAG